jgi:hypothetical protein
MAAYTSFRQALGPFPFPESLLPSAVDACDHVLGDELAHVVVAQGAQALVPESGSIGGDSWGWCWLEVQGWGASVELQQLQQWCLHLFQSPHPLPYLYASHAPQMRSFSSLYIPCFLCTQCWIAQLPMHSGTRLTAPHAFWQHALHAPPP